MIKSDSISQLVCKKILPTTITFAKFFNTHTLLYCESNDTTKNVISAVYKIVRMSISMNTCCPFIFLRKLFLSLHWCPVGTMFNNSWFFRRVILLFYPLFVLDFNAGFFFFLFRDLLDGGINSPSRLVCGVWYRLYIQYHRSQVVSICLFSDGDILLFKNFALRHQ